MTLATALRYRAAIEGKPIKLRKAPRPLWPTKARAEYYKALRAMTEAVQEIVRRDLFPQLARIVAAHNVTRPEDEPIGARTDAQPRDPKGTPTGGQFASTGGASRAGSTAAPARKPGKPVTMTMLNERAAKNRARRAAKKAEALEEGNKMRAAAHGATTRTHDPAMEGTHAELNRALAADRAALLQGELPSPFKSSGVLGAGPLEVHVEPGLHASVHSAVTSHATRMTADGALTDVSTTLNTAAPQHTATSALWVDNWAGESTVPSANHAFEQLSQPGSWAQAQYGATQASIRHHLPELQAKGIIDKDGYITLHRGVRGEQATAARAEFERGGGNANVKMRKTSSWTESHEVARDDFAGDDGVVLTQRVHHSRAFATWRTQSGESSMALNEQREWTLIADQGAMLVRRGK